MRNGLLASSRTGRHATASSPWWALSDGPSLSARSGSSLPAEESGPPLAGVELGLGAGWYEARASERRRGSLLFRLSSYSSLLLGAPNQLALCWPINVFTRPTTSLEPDRRTPETGSRRSPNWAAAGGEVSGGSRASLPCGVSWPGPRWPIAGPRRRQLSLIVTSKGEDRGRVRGGHNHRGSAATEMQLLILRLSASGARCQRARLNKASRSSCQRTAASWP